MVRRPALLLLLLLLLLPFSESMQKSAGISTADLAYKNRTAARTPKTDSICKECSGKNEIHLQSTKVHIAPASFTPSHTVRKTGGHRQCHKAVQQHPQNCSLIRAKCSGYGDGMFNYVELYYCRYSGWHLTSLALLLVWLSLLFIWLGVSASEYFSPNISTLAKLLRLPESLAGVTLLAFGNGAPDMFSTFSAVRAGSGALAIGQLVGSASFIVGVVLSATTFVSPVYRVSSIPYLRELCFFTATIGVVAAVVLSEKLTQGMAACMVGLYIMYVVAVVLTTYYEEKSQGTRLQVRTDDTADSILQPPPESTSISTSSTESRSWYTGIAGHSASMLLEPLWARSNTSLASVTKRQQWHRRRITTSATHINLAGSDMWALDTLKESASVRALGDFLSQHRKSLLAAAECGEILDQVHHGGDLEDRLGVSGNPDEAMPLQGEHANREPGYATIPISSTAQNDMHESTCAQAEVLELSSPLIPPPPSPWNNYSMGRVDAGSSKCDTYPRENADAIHETAAENSRQWSESDTTPSRYLHIISLGNHHPPHKQPSSVSATSGLQRTSTSPLSQLPSCALVEDGTQTSYGSHSSLNRHTAQVEMPHTEDSGNVSASIIIPSTPQSFHAALASTDRDSIPCIWPSPSASISVDMAGHKCSRGAAIARACIPTLHYWHPEASVKLKAFIAFSAIPVFLMTLTVPVLVFSSDDGSSDSTSCSTTRYTPQEQAGEQPAGCNIAETRPDTGQVCIQQDRVSGDSHSTFSAQIPHASSSSRSTPAAVCIVSGPSLPNEQSQDPEIEQQPYTSSFPAESHSSANIKWAEDVASYLRSVVSVVFLSHALYYSGLLAPNIDRRTQNTLSIGLAAISMAGNYLLRRFSFGTYWLQVAIPCFAGFACGLVWVSIIADEIVSITQALGLVLGLSEEILGLTIVGFGNSLGDLVTNLTLTRMGYPMMAVSACFGGPMLYILLGIGVAACGIMTSSGPIGDTYLIPITSPSVLVSTACLVINSMIFLVAVPLQGFRITRTVGIAALCVYMVGMGFNIYLEL